MRASKSVLQVMLFLVILLLLYLELQHVIFRINKKSVATTTVPTPSSAKVVPCAPSATADVRTQHEDKTSLSEDT